MVQGGGGSRPALEMTLVKSLYSGDPDVIGYNVDVIGLHDRWCYSGKSHKFRTTAIILNLPTYEPLIASISP